MSRLLMWEGAVKCRFLFFLRDEDTNRLYFIVNPATGRETIGRETFGTRLASRRDSIARRSSVRIQRADRTCVVHNKGGSNETREHMRYIARDFLSARGKRTKNKSRVYARRLRRFLAARNIARSPFDRARLRAISDPINSPLTIRRHNARQKKSCSASRAVVRSF